MVAHLEKELFDCCNEALSHSDFVNDSQMTRWVKSLPYVVGGNLCEFANLASFHDQILTHNFDRVVTICLYISSFIAFFRVLTDHAVWAL